MENKRINALSLFANVGIAETYLKDVGVDVVLANELLTERGKFYQHLYPECEMIIGDFTEQQVYSEIMRKAKERNVQFLLATPPCQGMSLAGKKQEDDERNTLIEYVVNAIHDLKPKFVFMENVTMQLKTRINYGGKKY